MGPRPKNALQKPLNDLLKIPSQIRSCVPLLALACLLAVGCSSLKVKMGMRVDLNQTPISSIQASLPRGPAIAPGQKSPLVVSLTQPNGKVLVTEGQGAGKVMWKDLQVDATVVLADEKGILQLPEDPRASFGKVGHVSITVPSQPNLRAELDVPVRYNAAFVSDFSGRPGASGMSGQDGLNGTSGSTGSMDPNNPSPGGNGSDGSNGSDGKDGEPGGNAPRVDVLITLQPEELTAKEAHPLLQVSVSAPSHRRLYLIDPHGGSLTVKADGGPGGSGGRGGRGGRGGSGGMGTPNGSSGHDGSDGRSGWDGAQGKGGLITVTYDPQAAPFMGVLHLSSRNGPAPLYKGAPVSPLW